MIIGLVLDDTLDKPDGVQQAVVAIGEELRLRNHEVHYIVTETSRTDLKNIHGMVKYLGFKFNGNTVRTPLPVSRSKIKKLFSEINFDVLHVQMPYSPFFSAKIIRQSPNTTVKVGTFHILPYNSFAKIGTKILGLILTRNKRLFTHAFAVSKPALEFMENSFGLAGTVLSNPVDYNFYNKFTKQPKTKKQIVFVGRFDVRKGVRELVEAYSLLPKDIRDNTTLTMCGKGPLLEELQLLAKKNKVAIEFPGFVTDDEKAQFLANADIAVFPSISGESFGIVLTEAMSAGSGITIGGNNPGYSSVLGQWPDALFDPRHINSFSEKIKYLLTHDAERKKIGKNQHEIVKQYDIHKIVDELEKIYSIG